MVGASEDTHVVSQHRQVAGSETRVVQALTPLITTGTPLTAADHAALTAGELVSQVRQEERLLKGVP